MNPEKAIREAGKERYGIPLVLILLASVFIMGAPSGEWGNVFIIALEGAALVTSTRAAQANFGLRVTCGILAGLALFMSILAAAFGFDGHSVYVSSASVILVVVATPVIALGIVRQVKEGQSVTVHTMLGGLCVYLLMTLAFASAFGIIGGASDQPFFTQGEDFGELRNYLYFSITTMSTLGLGDFTPAQDVGRSLTAAESLIGQIYLVTVVAVIVGNLGRRGSSGEN